MQTWIAKVVVLAASAALVGIRAPHGQRSRSVRVVSSRVGAVERVLLSLIWVGFLLPLAWLVSPWLEFADRPLHLEPFAAGCVSYLAGLWLFFRSHADLGTNWSITLELRENHTLVAAGVYRRIRHPMYLALLLYSAGQALVLPNWLAGPASLATFLPLLALRLQAEERMLHEHFGTQWEAYCARTKRLLPGLW